MTLARCGLLVTLPFLGCATEPTTPPVVHYLQAGPAPHFAEQVEILKGSMIQLRSGDILSEAQAQRVKDAVEIDFNVINLSDHAIRLEAKDFSLVDTKGKECRSLKIKDVLLPILHKAVKTDDSSMDTASQRLAKTVQGENNRLAKSLTPPFLGATVPVNKKISGTLYFEHPKSWPVEFKIHADQQQLVASFSGAVEP